MPRHKARCPEFTWTAGFVSSDFETDNGPNSTPIPPGLVLDALYLRCMHYRSLETEDAYRKLVDTLQRDEMTVTDGISVFYWYHSQWAKRVNDGINSEGSFDPGFVERVTLQTDSSSDGDEVSSASPVMVDQKKMVTVTVREAIPLPTLGDPRWVDAVQRTVADVDRFMRDVYAETLFRTLARKHLAGVEEVVRYIIRCNKTPSYVMKMIGNEVPLRDVSAALLACGYDKSDVRTAAREVPDVYLQKDIDDAGLNTSALIQRVEHRCYSGSSEAATKGKAEDDTASSLENGA